MKQIRLILSLALGLLLLTGCNGDEPVRIDTNYMEELTRGSASTCYSLSSFDAFKREATPNALWEKQDMKNLIGWQLPAPGKIIIHDGKIWSPLELFQISLGWHSLYYPYRAYQRKTKSDTQFYVVRPFDFNSEKNILTLEDGIFDWKNEYGVEVADENKLTLIFLEYDSNGEPTWKYVINYNKSKINISELTSNPFYDSNKEAKLAMIKLLRDEFGTPFDMNPYFVNMIEFPGPVDLDRIEYYVEEGTDWQNHDDTMIYERPTYPPTASGE